MKRLLTALPFLAFPAAVALLAGAALLGTAAALMAGPDDALRVPAVDYRAEWVQLGTFSLAADAPADDPAEGARELHVVHAPPEAVAHYRRTGEFPDGAMLLKEVFAAATEPLTTGFASYPGALTARFVMVRDADDSEAGRSPLWGDGWGWALYEGAETEVTVTTDYRDDCLACHEPARATGLVYVQGYPVLRRD